MLMTIEVMLLLAVLWQVVMLVRRPETSRSRQDRLPIALFPPLCLSHRLRSVGGDDGCGDVAAFQFEK
jgi:hypothetical protein